MLGNSFARGSSGWPNAWRRPDMLREPEFRFHHLGLACRSIEMELSAWTRVGYRAEGEIFEDPIQKIRGVFVVGCGPRLELLEPAGEGSPIAGYLSRGVKLYHQAFVAQDFDVGLASLSALGAKLVAPAQPAVAFDGRRIAFLMMAGLNLLEIIEGPAAA